MPLAVHPIDVDIQMRDTAALLRITSLPQIPSQLRLFGAPRKWLATFQKQHQTYVWSVTIRECDSGASESPYIRKMTFEFLHLIAPYTMGKKEFAYSRLRAQLMSNKLTTK